MNKLNIIINLLIYSLDACRPINILINEIKKYKYK